MKKYGFIAATLLVAGIGTATAQTTTSQTTTTVVPTAPPPLIVPPPVGTLSTSQTQKTVLPDGSQIEKHKTTYRDGSGSASDTVTKVMPAPVIVPDSSTTTTRTTTTTQP
ncbi:MAG TPA: hypothetical protein VL154_05680 [Acetobacteraceae bacterium]|jgi:hypothetical protein|nr:hypothetical protein [Acetobacteraceae bacterium]